MPKTKNWRDLRAETIDTPEKEAAVAREREMLALERKLFNLRKQVGLSQADLAGRMETTQANISRIEKEDDLKLSTLDNYIAGLGGHLEIRAVFPDGEDIVAAEPASARAAQGPSAITSAGVAGSGSWASVVLWSGLPALHDRRVTVPHTRSGRTTGHKPRQP